jgi:hypothetical protein
VPIIYELVSSCRTFYDGNALFDETNHGNDMDDAGAGVTRTCGGNSAPV